MQRIAVVTGGNGGLGREISSQLAGQGIRVISCARNVNKGLDVVKEFNRQELPVIFHELDVTSVASIEASAFFWKRNWAVVMS